MLICTPPVYSFVFVAGKVGYYYTGFSMSFHNCNYIGGHLKSGSRLLLNNKSTLFRLLHHLLDHLHKLTCRGCIQLHCHSCPRASRLADEVKVEGIFQGHIEGMVITHACLVQLDPTCTLSSSYRLFSSAGRSSTAMVFPSIHPPPAPSSRAGCSNPGTPSNAPRRSFQSGSRHHP